MNQSEVRLLILQVLNAAKSQGANGKLIAECLKIEDMALLTRSLTWLRKKHLIRMNTQAFFTPSILVREVELQESPKESPHPPYSKNPYFESKK